MLETVTGYLEKALKSTHTGSALSPLIWLNGIVSVPCLLLSAFISPPMNFAFFVLAVGVVGYTLLEYRTLRKINPRLVQSEKHQYELAKLDLVATKGGPVVFDPVSLDFGTEPRYLPQPKADDEEEGAEQ